LEQPGTWGADALRQSGLPPGVSQTLRGLPPELGLRVLLLRRPDPFLTADPQCFAAHSAARVPWMEQRVLDRHELKRDARAKAAGGTRAKAPGGTRAKATGGTRAEAAGGRASAASGTTLTAAAAASGSIVLYWWAVSHQVPPSPTASHPAPTMNVNALCAGTRYAG
ncbi:MAG: hypothetical protein ABR562_10295, partial [Thermoplasmatota archaeon]